jgi:hypothetical protein
LYRSKKVWGLGSAALAIRSRKRRRAARVRERRRVETRTRGTTAMAASKRCRRASYNVTSQRSQRVSHDMDGPLYARAEPCSGTLEQGDAPQVCRLASVRV